MLKSAGFTGRSDNRVDAKGRINIPAAFRKILAPKEHDEVVILFVPTGHLLLFNKEYWGSTIQQSIIDRSHIIGSENMWKTIHRLSENSHMSTVDSQGRITIPGWLLEKAGIKKNVVTLCKISQCYYRHMIYPLYTSIQITFPFQQVKSG